MVHTLIFHQEEDEDDDEFAFPIDPQANSRVVRCVFSLKFIDKLVAFVINRLHKMIKLTDVIPTVTFHDSFFDKLLHFFTRSISSIEYGQGPLTPYVDDCIYLLLSLYAANPYLRYTSSQINSDPAAQRYLLNHDSSYLYIFTHVKAHPMLKYALSTSQYIATNLTRTKDHDDSYFAEFLNFGEGVYNLAHALCYSIEKQKANAI